MASDAQSVAKVPHAPRWRRRGRDIALVLGTLWLVHLWQVRAVPAGPAPELAGAAVQGNYRSLAEFRTAHPGRAVAIHFWADWCPICRLEEDNIESLRQDHPVLTVAMQSGDPQAVASILAQRGLPWPTLTDSLGKQGAAWGLSGVPALIVVDPAGRVRFAAVGYVPRFGMRWRMWWANHIPLLG